MAEKNTPNRTYSEKCSVMTPKWIAAAPRERAARATGSVRAEAAVHQVRKSIVLIHPDYEPVEHLVLALWILAVPPVRALAMASDPKRPGDEHSRSGFSGSPVFLDLDP